MRFAVIADIHSNIDALQAVLKDIEHKGIGDTYCLGDTVGYCALPNEVISELRQRNIRTLQGNYDESVGEELFTCGCDFADAESARLGEISNNWTIDNTSDDNKEWLRTLPKQISFSVGTLQVLMVHGSPRKNNEYLHGHLSEAEFTEATATADFDVLLCGHTHVPYHRMVSGKHIINPGSVGKPKHGNYNAVYGIVEIVNNTVTLTTVEIAYDNHKAGEAIIAAGLPVQFAQAIS